MLLVPDDDPPDQDHGRHGPQGDSPCEQEVGTGESGQGGGVHQGVQRPGEERGEGRHQGQAGEDPTHLGQVNTLTERRMMLQTFVLIFIQIWHLSIDLDREYFG